MVDKHIDDLHSEEVSKLVSESIDLGEKKPDTSLQDLDNKLIEQDKVQKLDSTKWETDRELTMLKDEVRKPGIKKEKEVATAWLPSNIRQSFNKAQEKYGWSPDSAQWREESYVNVLNILENAHGPLARLNEKDNH